MLHHFSRRPVRPMRTSLIAPLLISILLAACSTKGDIPVSKHIDQKGPLKVHPALLGQPVPPELQAEATPAPVASAPASEIKLDPAGLRTQRSIYFDLDSASIKTDYMPALQAHARYLADHPKAVVRIAAHADGKPAQNRLALQRAENVRNILLANGATKQQVRMQLRSAGKMKSAAQVDAVLAENRRCDIVYEREE